MRSTSGESGGGIGGVGAAVCGRTEATGAVGGGSGCLGLGLEVGRKGFWKEIVRRVVDGVVGVQRRDGVGEGEEVGEISGDTGSVVVEMERSFGGGIDTGMPVGDELLCMGCFGVVSRVGSGLGGRRCRWADLECGRGMRRGGEGEGWEEKEKAMA